MKYSVRPLSDRTWLRPSSRRTGTRFSSSWKETEQLLLDEVDRLNGQDLVIEVDVREQDLRLDGTLRANAREASSPGVVVAFESRQHGAMLYRCDTFHAPYTFQGPDWQHNVRAIALTLQSLRAVDRYGATETGQQYQGFKAIGGGAATAMPASMGHAEALAVVHKLTGFRLEGDPLAETTQRAWRQARAAVHPDRRAGDHEAWNLVEQAGRVLGVTR